MPETISYNFHIRPILSQNCYACHGPDANQREAGLRFDLQDNAFAALKENPNAHALVPGNPSSSVAYQRIISSEPTEKMPPPESNLALSEHEVRLIKKWIQQGAVYEPHWAFLVPEKKPLPKVREENWPRNELDYYILSAQEDEGLSPNPIADKEMFLKRLSFDITGLPPDLDLMEKFNNNRISEEEVIDQLLEHKGYGEKMAVHWMDVARYADSHGYQDDYYRTQWPWRDWVIHAFNKNMPYDQFLTWQLAGDLLPNATKEQILATGFNRNHKITEESGAIDEEYRSMYVIDRTNTLGKAILGVTIECAQCHDHKFDPISQKEYFQLYAFFNNVAEYGMEESTPGFSKKSPAKLPMLEITDSDVENILSFVNFPDSVTHVKSIIGKVDKGANHLSLLSESDVLKVSVMGDADSLRKTFILERGDYASPGKEVQHGTPDAILRFPEQFPKNRLGLSKWLFDKNNPLTARVFVNRIWQEIFGTGLVNTPGDFGMQGALPSHPELLDWLAVDFMESGWDIKALIKKIVSSATYHQSSAVDPTKLEKDPENRYISRFPRFRLPAEQVRNLVLASSGLLVPEIGGPSVKPYQPEGLWESAGSGRGNLSEYEQDSGKSLYRRGLYTFIKRTVPPPTMILFDASNRDGCEVERVRTNTPLQALVMMNDPTVLEASRVLASSLLKDNSLESDREAKIFKAFKLIIGRTPDTQELAILKGYHDDQLNIYKEKVDVAGKLVNVGEFPLVKSLPLPQLAALMQVVQTIYNMEEAITKS
ncbi:MAG: PSD1 and planctomycete cytochrome C domain-containing protein [Cyclobacteriaceae bacterium]